MTSYALIDKAQALVRIQDLNGEPPALANEKGLSWVPFVEIPAEPLSDQVRNGYIDAMEAGQWVRRHLVRDMTATEREARRVEQLRVSDARDMARMVEDILVIVAQSGVVSISRNSFPDGLWDKINARRALRGLEAV